MYIYVLRPQIIGSVKLDWGMEGDLSDGRRERVVEGTMAVAGGAKKMSKYANQRRRERPFSAKK